MEKKPIYLTIDDSPSHNFIEKILFLEEKKIPAIFFCIGNKIEKKLDYIQTSVTQKWLQYHGNPEPLFHFMVTYT